MPKGKNIIIETIDLIKQIGGLEARIKKLEDEKNEGWYTKIKVVGDTFIIEGPGDDGQTYTETLPYTSRGVSDSVDETEHYKNVQNLLYSVLDTFSPNSKHNAFRIKVSIIRQRWRNKDTNEIEYCDELLED